MHGILRYFHMTLNWPDPNHTSKFSATVYIFSVLGYHKKSFGWMDQNALKTLQYLYQIQEN